MTMQFNARHFEHISPEAMPDCITGRKNPKSLFQQ